MKELYTALGKFQDVCPKITKSADNPYFKSKYAELSSIVNLITPALRKTGLVVIQPVVGDCVRTIVAHPESGQEISSEYPLNKNENPQKFGAEVTYARRYSLTSVLGIVAEDDDDGNTASGKTTEKPTYKTPTPEKTAESKGIKEEVSALAKEVAELLGESTDNVMQEASGFTGKDGLVYIKNIDKASEKWLGNTLKRLKEMKKNVSGGDEPPF